VFYFCIFGIKLDLFYATCSVLQGNSYEADIVIKCTGLLPQTSLTETIFGKIIFISKTGQLTVEKWALTIF